MKQVFSLFLFGIGGLFFLAFFATLKPTVLSAASGPGVPRPCVTQTPPSVACRSLAFATALWPDAARRT